MRFSGMYPPGFLDMPADDTCSVLLKAKDKEEENRLFFRWCLVGQTECSFDEFKAMLKPAPKRSVKSILKEVDGYIEQFCIGFECVGTIDGNF